MEAKARGGGWFGAKASVPETSDRIPAPFIQRVCVFLEYT